MKKATYLLALLVTMVNISSCQKSIDKDEIKTREAVTFFTGSPSLDGCGWLLQTDRDTLSPKNFPVEFQKENLKLKVEYTIIADSFSCGWSRYPYKIVELTKVQLR